MRPTRRAQSNVDFVIAMFILIVFLTATLFTAGSPLLEGGRSEVDYRLDAQRMLVELTAQLSDDNGQLSDSKTETMLSSGLEAYVSTGDRIEANLTVRPTNINDSAPLFDGDSERTVGPRIPDTKTSTAAKTVRIDNRVTRMELALWVDFE